MAGAVMRTWANEGASSGRAVDTARSLGPVTSHMLGLRSLVQAPAMIALLSGRDHVYEFVNERYLAFMGDRGFVGKRVRDVVPEVVDQGVVEILDRVYETGEPFMATEMSLQFVLGATGTLNEGFFNLIYQPLRTDNRSVTGIMVHAVDVTEQVLTRRRLERLAAEHTAVLRQMADAVIVVDPAGCISFQNEAARRLLGADGVGLTLEEALTRVRLLTLDGVPLAAAQMWLTEVAQSGGSTRDLERRVQRPDGTELIVQGRVAPVIAEDGSRCGAVCTFRDVTEQKRLEEARFALAALVESSSDAIVGATTEGIITSWDRGAERLYGYAASEAVGRPASVIVPADRADEMRAVLTRVKRGESVEHLDTVRLHKDGHLVDISVSVSPIKDAAGRIIGAVSIAHSIGERKRLERERSSHQQELTTRVLQAQEDERKRIARELHDETIQDLTTLLISLDVAERHLNGGSGSGVNVLGRVRAIASRALDETRALAHSLRPPILDDVGLAAALEALGEECAQTYGVDVPTRATSECRLAPYVETVVFRVAQEALTNACKHAGGSRVSIDFCVSSGVGELIVADNGRGFDPRAIKAAGRHCGLGLDGMNERAALVGGSLEVDASPGRGTRITLRVPFDGLQSPCCSDGELNAQECHGATTMRVLLADDHAMVREGLRGILASQPGLRVIGEAEDGREALQLAESLHPDVVVMDIAMPNLNGLDATRQIKREFADIRVLILTSHESRQYVTQIVKTGADGCLLKRSAGTELITALETLRDGRRYVSPSLACTLLDDYRVRIDHGGDDPLTEREREVVQLVAEGHTNQGIARKLGISVKTVETHRTNIMEKLGATDRTDLVKYAIRSGMISAE